MKIFNYLLLLTLTEVLERKFLKKFKVRFLFGLLFLNQINLSKITKTIWWGTSVMSVSCPPTILEPFEKFYWFYLIFWKQRTFIFWEKVISKEVLLFKFFKFYLCFFRLSTYLHLIPNDDGKRTPRKLWNIFLN